MKKWETQEWWEKRQWTEEDIEEMWKEERERLSQQPWFEPGKPCRYPIFQERDWEDEFERNWGKWGAQGIGKLRKVSLLAFVSLIPYSPQPAHLLMGSFLSPVPKPPNPYPFVLLHPDILAVMLKSVGTV